jgi:hypothetical protein
MITTNIIQRVFRISHNGRTASAYTIEKGDNQYLVSAAHVFDGSLEIPHITIYHDGKWKSISVQIAFNSRDIGDTIIFKLPHDISPRHHVSLGTANIILGSWAYFLGFPFGMTNPDKGINNNFPIPFVKAGLISGLNFEREGLCTIFLDGHNNKGFSGGPVIWINPQNNKEIQIIGTISGYLTESPIHTQTLDDIKDHGTNAGIIEAFWIKDILNQI